MKYYSGCEEEARKKTKDFRAKQEMDFEFKKEYATRRAWEFYNHPEVAGRCYVAVGGLDSITLFLFLRSIGISVPATSVSSLEDKSIQIIHKALGIKSLLPVISPDTGRPYSKIEVIRNYGFPVLSKETAQKISHIQNPTDKNKTVRHAIVTGETGEYGGFRKNTRMKMSQKWLNKFAGPENETEGTNYQTAPFLVSDACCYYLKEKPCDDYAKQSGRFPYMGLMASEGGRREKSLILNGCNYVTKTTKRSAPFAIFTRQDILLLALEMNDWYHEHWKEFQPITGTDKNGDPILGEPIHLESTIPAIYGTIEKDDEGNLRTTKAQRTGCSMCGFGIHLEKRPHRFDLLRYRSPKEWGMWMNHVCQDSSGEWFGWGRVLDYIGVGWNDDILDASAPKMICSECAERIGKDFDMKPAEGESVKRGSCWACGRKRPITPFYAEKRAENDLC